MSINMNLEDSRRQAESIEKEMKNKIEGYEGLIRAITKISYTTGELKGQAYDAMREYFEEVIMPIVKGGKLLLELITKVSKELPERYVREVHSSSLNEEELELIIAEYRAQERRLESLMSNEIVQGEYKYKNHLLVSSNAYRNMRRYYEELLHKLRLFNQRTEHITREIEELSRAIREGLRSIGNTSCYNSMSGEFDIKELKGEEWLRKLNILNELNEARKIETREEKEYKEVLMKDFGFDERTTNLILKLKRAIDKKFAHLSKEERFYIFNRIIGARHYKGFKWAGTAGDLMEYFYKEELLTTQLNKVKDLNLKNKLEGIYRQLGLTKKEYLQLTYELDNQHRFSGEKEIDGNYMFKNPDKKKDIEEKFKKEYAEYKKVYGEHLTIKDFIDKWNRDKEAYYGKGDCTHQSITMATNLYNYYFRPANIVGLMYSSVDSHKLTNELAGWRGDVTSQVVKKPSMNCDDYKADLDAVNILHLCNKDKNKNPIEVYNEYYKGIREGTINRAKMFKKIVGFKYIESEIQNKVLGNQGYYRFTNEELKKMNPVGYNFIMNLKNENNEYIEYEKVGDKK
ncbi:hypothetical protein [Parvimonas micra]|uniref:LXG domain-containing protein n=1 Tax=Parvimonas micra ATCC 33270 TaxID=411465 RepID=A8SJC7_9FIRM|nr:hypothetical protein [Parvimonas micra]EDP24422.1 hypothetical protein PEPMIC_00271 [Parvimonas micra ATCC 33270]RSB91290.1 hypothetical protein EGS00_06125 [Parvimonas micra]VEH94955.1 Bacillus transposase protein [Parvimonas micra]